MSGGLDWPGLLRVGLRGLGLRPGEFWRLTPAELAVMLGEAAGAPPLTRDRLSGLAARFPDTPRGGDLKGGGDGRG
ncbi:rcc01693 family protein [Rhodobacter capsulatus]|uniref:rcc01693 family protein n=1 Tax=Rhodobacter capsulatus TaxID=1061 RepID=UPI00402730AB